MRRPLAAKPEFAQVRAVGGHVIIGPFAESEEIVLASEPEEAPGAGFVGAIDHRHLFEKFAACWLVIAEVGPFAESEEISPNQPQGQGWVAVIIVVGVGCDA